MEITSDPAVVGDINQKKSSAIMVEDLRYSAVLRVFNHLLSLITKTQREPMRKLTPETIIIVD
jgi:hypothetical protein